MPSSTIMTRLSVPMSSTVAMPTEIWNSERRASRFSGRIGRCDIGERQIAQIDLRQLTGDERRDPLQRNDLQRL